MNSAYQNVRFRSELQTADLPECFGIVTAWNPNGEEDTEDANAKRNASLRDVLVEEGLTHFSVVGGSVDFSHAEPGFGIVASKDRCLELGSDFRQEAIFWVERGKVWLCSCKDEDKFPIGSWDDLAN